MNRFIIEMLLFFQNVKKFVQFFHHFLSFSATHMCEKFSFPGCINHVHI